MDVSFGTIWEAVAREQPDAIAIPEPGRDYSYAEWAERSARLAAALEAAGVGPGDTRSASALSLSLARWRTTAGRFPPVSAPA